MKKLSCFGDHVKIYNIDCFEIGSFTTISQYSYLCTASHDYLDPSINLTPKMKLITSPIKIGDKVWITTDVFIAPGVTIHNGCVVLARSTVLNDLPAWKVVGGYPAKIINEKHHGIIPNKYEDLICLPGVGEYTASAIVSFAFGKFSVVIDTNIRRFISRVNGLSKNDMVNKLKFNEVVKKMFPKSNSGKFAQAIMDFSSDICTKRNPSCDKCFLKNDCKF